MAWVMGRRRSVRPGARGGVAGMGRGIVELARQERTWPAWAQLSSWSNNASASENIARAATGRNSQRRGGVVARRRHRYRMAAWRGAWRQTWTKWRR